MSRKRQTCSAADVAENDVQISRERRHLQDKLPEADEGLVEKTSWTQTKTHRVKLCQSSYAHISLSET